MRQLQTQDKDSIKGYINADNVMSAVGSLLKNLKLQYTDVEKNVSVWRLQFQCLRLVISWTNCVRISTESPEVHFRISIFIPFFRQFL